MKSSTALLKIASAGKVAAKTDRYSDTDKRTTFGPIFRTILELAGTDFEGAFTRDDIVARLSKDEEYRGRFAAKDDKKFRALILGYIANPGIKDSLLKSAPKPK